MDKQTLISAHEKTIAEHFNQEFQQYIPIVIPFFNSDYEGIIQSGTFQVAPPIFERMEITFEDYVSYLKRKEYNKAFENIINE